MAALRSNWNLKVNILSGSVIKTRPKEEKIVKDVNMDKPYKEIKNFRGTTSIIGCMNFKRVSDNQSTSTGVD